MTFRFGNGWVTFERSIVAATGETALETKARAKVQREQSIEDSHEVRTAIEVSPIAKSSTSDRNFGLGEQ